MDKSITDKLIADILEILREELHNNLENILKLVSNEAFTIYDSVMNKKIEPKTIGGFKVLPQPLKQLGNVVVQPVISKQQQQNQDINPPKDKQKSEPLDTIDNILPKKTDADILFEIITMTCEKLCISINNSDMLICKSREEYEILTNYRDMLKKTQQDALLEFQKRYSMIEPDTKEDKKKDKKKKGFF